jgi:predicted Zn-dependent protease
MDEVFFETEAGWHIVWSSSTDSKYNNLKFVLDFTDGHLDTKHKDNTTFQVRVVRGTTDNNQTRKEVVSPTVEQLIVENTNSANAEQHIQKMLRSAMINDQNSIQASKQYLENQPKPAKGDKKAAREVNDEALVFIKNKQYAQAVSLLAKASQLDPSDVEILNNYGFVLMMTNNLEQAESVLIKTLTMKPDRSLAWSNLGFAFALQGKKDMAVASYLNTYLFSKDPEKTLQFFKDILAQESNINVKNALTKAVDEILTDND